MCGPWSGCTKVPGRHWLAMPCSVGVAGAVVGFPAPRPGVRCLFHSIRVTRDSLARPAHTAQPHIPCLWDHSWSCGAAGCDTGCLLLLEWLQAFLWLQGEGNEQVVNVPRGNAKNNSLVTAPHSLLEIELLNECYPAKSFFLLHFLGPFEDNH